MACRLWGRNTDSPEACHPRGRTWLSFRPERLRLATVVLITGFGYFGYGCGSSWPELGKSSAFNRPALLLNPSHAEWRRPAPAVYHARFETNEGVFVVEAVREHAPIGADRFYNLVRLGYYDDARFHRVVDEYIAQFGLHGDPAVNNAWLNQQIPDDPAHGSNVRGTLAFAMSPEPRTRNTQVYINLSDNTRNDREPFAIFGRVIEGMEVLDRLYSGYGESSGSGVRQGRQGPIIEGGNAYLDREFPLLDRIIRATVTDASRQ